MICEICNKKTSRLKVHLRLHGFESIEEAYICLKLGGNRPRCSCGRCNEHTQFVSWHKGFRKYQHGHNAKPKSNEQCQNVCENMQREHAKIYSRFRVDSRLKNNSHTIHSLGLDKIRLILEKSSPNFEFIENHMRDSTSTVFVLKCRSCHSLQEKSATDLFNNICPTCDPGGSKAHTELYRYTRSLDEDCLIAAENVIPPDYVDIYVPGARLAIEYNSLYFHSEAFKRRLYHLQKTRSCNQLGINLLHIYEDEWRDHREACKNHVRVLWQEQTAPKCPEQLSFLVMGDGERSTALSHYHIEGDTNALIAVSILLGEEILGFACVRKPRHASHGKSIELSRFVNISVYSSFSLLASTVSYFKEVFKDKKIYCVLDSRTGMSSIYRKAGFEVVKTLEPRYWWTDGYQKISRHKILGAAAKECMLVKIWSCDLLLMEIKRPLI